MKTSTDRMLTTQVGSLTRPHSLLDLMCDRFQGMPGLMLRIRAAYSLRQPEIHPQPVWEEFRAPSTGAEIATGRRW